MDYLNVTYSTKDFPEILYKLSYKFYNISISSDVSERVINILQEYHVEKEKYSSNLDAVKE